MVLDSYLYIVWHPADFGWSPEKHLIVASLSTSRKISLWRSKCLHFHWRSDGSGNMYNMPQGLLIGRLGI